MNNYLNGLVGHSNRLSKELVNRSYGLINHSRNRLNGLEQMNKSFKWFGQLFEQMTKINWLNGLRNSPKQ